MTHRSTFRTHALTLASLAASSFLLVSCDLEDDGELEDADVTPENEADYREASGNTDFVFQSALQKGLGGTNGQSDYCRNPANKCTAGEGNCRNSTECDTGLTCVNDMGARYGLSPSTNVCQPAHCTNGVQDAGNGETGIDCGGDCGSCTRPPSFRVNTSLYCSIPFPCDAYEGNCSLPTRPCADGLICGTDNGGSFGLNPAFDLCVPDLCANGELDPGEDDVDCGGTCTAVCSRPVNIKNGDSRFCSKAFPCGVGEGNCAPPTRPCEDGLVCATDNAIRFGLKPTLDTCVPAHCINGALDAGNGETGIDCGGDCGSCTRPPSILPGTAFFCSDIFPCEAGEGLCGTNRPCVAGTSCQIDVGASFGFLPQGDVCVCDAESTDEAMCSRLGAECGALTAEDLCGATRIVESCGGCTGGANCVDNLCTCDPGFTYCAGACIDTANDPDNCGACGNVCNGIEDTCSNGICVAVSKVAAGNDHSCALITDGTIRCWGYNANGQLGMGDTTTRLSPVEVPGISSAQDVSTGLFHTCVVNADGTVSCWGINTNGQLGDGTSGVDRLSPVSVSGITTATAVATGAQHSCAILSDGTARCWGANNQGQLGNGTQTASTTPVTVSGLSNAVEIMAGTNHTCARLSDKTVRCWGLNSSGQLGNNSTSRATTPVSPSSLTTVEEIAIGANANFSCARLTNGTLRCWGNNGSGQIGDGTRTNRLVPTQVSAITTATAIGAGSSHTCATLADQTARCWGFAFSGQIGDGTQGDTNFRRLTPTAVTDVTNAVEIVGGGAHSCAKTSNGNVKCWGIDLYGHCGDGTTGDANNRRLTAVDVVW